MKIPKLRFKEFSGEWEEKNFNEVFLFLQNNTFSRECLTNEKQEVQNIHYGDILVKYNNILNVDDNIPFIKKENNLKKFNEESYLRTGDIVIADTAEDFTVGKTIEIKNIENKKLLAGLHTFACRTNFKFSFGYLGQYMNSNQYHSQLYTLVTGIKVSAISKQSIKDTKINYPISLEEQKKIGNFLSSVDKKISITEEKLNLFKEYKKGMMQKIFKQKIRFKDSNGNNYPDWVEKPLGELGEFKNGVNKGKDDFGSGYPFINLLDIFGKKFIENNDNLALVNVSEKELNDFNILKGDVLFVRSSVKPEGVGLTTIVTKDLENTVYSGFIIRFRENANKLDLEYKKNCFYDEEFRKALLNKSTISANTNINQDNLKILKIKLPCLEEQKKIGSFLSSIDNKIENLSNELENLKDFKKGLLQKMFV